MKIIFNYFDLSQIENVNELVCTKLNTKCKKLSKIKIKTKLVFILHIFFFFIKKRHGKV